MAFNNPMRSQFPFCECVLLISSMAWSGVAAAQTVVGEVLSETAGQWAGPYYMEGFINPGDPENDPDDRNWGEFAHIAILPPPNQGLVLLWNPRADMGVMGTPTYPAGDTTQQTFVWNPQTPNQLTVIPVGNDPAGSEEIFCGGHTFTEDGQLIVAGGTNAVDLLTGGPFGMDRVFVFDNAALDPPGSMPTWRQLTPTDRRRFYPSVVRRGSEIVVAGHTQVDAHSNPLTGSTRETGLLAGTGAGLSVTWDAGQDAPSNFQEDVFCNPGLVGTEYSVGDYPRWHVLRNGSLFRTHAFQSFLLFDVCAGAGLPVGQEDRFAVRDQQDLFLQPTNDVMNSVHLLYHDGFEMNEVIYSIGGSSYEQCSPNISTKVRKMVNPIETPPTLWEVAPDLTFSRMDSNTVILLDGSMVVIGGYGYDTTLADCVGRKVPERYEPVEIFGDPTATWVGMNPQDHQRFYHSVAALLPDGSVVSAGGRRDQVADPGPAAPESHYSIEVYKPPYFFSTRPRPRITAVPATFIDYNLPFTFDAILSSTETETTTRVALIAPGTATHAFDFNQRYLDLQVINVFQPDPTSPATITATAPENAFQAPPGWYMLTAINKRGLPSVARWVRVGS